VYFNFLGCVYSAILFPDCTAVFTFNLEIITNAIQWYLNDTDIASYIIKYTVLHNYPDSLVPNKNSSVDS